jgi:presenilin-like A22 family membrane protease
MNDTQKINEIFDDARQQEPNYSNANFISQVNIGIKRERLLSRLRSCSIMVIAALIGIITINTQIPLHLLLSKIPASIVINPTSIMLAVGLSSGLCYFTYFVLED